jgi:hypothetical protein
MDPPGGPKRIRIRASGSDASSSSTSLRPRYVDSIETQRTSLRIPRPAPAATVRPTIVVGSAFAPRPTQDPESSDSSASSAVSLSSASSTHTISSGDDDSSSSSSVEFVGSHYQPRINPYRGESLGERAQRYGLFREAIIEGDPNDVSTRPELIDILKFHSGQLQCCACRTRIARGVLCMDFRIRTANTPVKHCHVEPRCLSNENLFFPTDPRLIRFDPQIRVDERQTVIRVLAQSIPGPSPERVLYPLVRPGDPDRRIQRQRDFLNQELQRAARVQENARMMIHRNMIARQYYNERFRGMEWLDIPIHRLPGLEPQAPRGLPSEVLMSLPRVKLGTVEDSCVICLEDMGPGNEIVVLPCFHRYHYDCIAEWTKNSKLCPMDKLNIEDLAGRCEHSQAVRNADYEVGY